MFTTIARGVSHELSSVDLHGAEFLEEPPFCKSAALRLLILDTTEIARMT